MKIVTGEMQSGKTTELIKMAARDYLYIVCPTFQRCEAVANHAIDLGLKIPFPVSFREFLENKVGYFLHSKGVLIDDLDSCIATYSRTPILAVSICEPVIARLRVGE